MNTELYNQLVNADSVCKQASEHFEKANELEAQAARASSVSKVGFVWAGIGIGAAIYFVFGFLGTITGVMALNMLGLGGAVAAGIFSFKYLYNNKKKQREAAAQPYLEQAAQERAIAQQVFDNGYEAVSIIPADYWYPMATEYMARVVQTGRANTVSEALAMYDEQLHRWKMENAQMEILAQQQLQTAQLQSIKRSSAVSAGANVANVITNIAGRL